MSSILRIQFPEDFEERYDAYKARLSGQTINRLNILSKSKIKNNTSDKIDKKFPHKLPSGTKWENFTVMFLTDEKVSVMVQGYTEELDFRTMGFEDKRTMKPNSQWSLLILFAKYQGEIDWKTQVAEDKLKKCKERLAAQLRNYFSIDYDPFYPYVDNKSYKIKLTLSPPIRDEEEGKNEILTKKMPEIDKSEKLTEEIEDIFKDLTDNS